MLVKIRENIFIGDENVKAKDLKENAITVVEVVAPMVFPEVNKETIYFMVGLYNPADGVVNRPHVKDIACHIPKYMSQNGEVVVVISKTGLSRAAYVVARAICELEQKSIYDVFVELQEKLPGFEIGKAYL